MALVWADPFDQYGTSNAMFLNAGYSVAPNQGIAATGRTGPHAITINSGVVRRALNNVATTLGQGVGLQVNSLSGGDASSSSGLRWESAGNTLECSVIVTSTLGIAVYDRTNVLKGVSVANKLIIGSYFWVEAKAIGNVAGVNTGSVEVRINGVVQLIVNGINLPNAFVFHGLGPNAVSHNCSYDDYIVWDNTGAKNNDFMGDRRLFASYPNVNLALQDFTPTPAGNAFDRINDSPAVDTNYIEGAAAGNISEFSKDLIAIDSNDIAAMVIFGRLFKSDAGVASGRVGVNSAGNVLNSPELFPGTTGAYFQFIIENDPNGTIPWTRVNYDNANLRLTRAQ